MSEKQDFEVGCRWCKKRVVLKVRPEDITKWRNGALIQNAMPYLTAGERELLISGTCDDCWKSMFSDDSDDSDWEYDDEG